MKAARKKLILDPLQFEILEQMHTADLTGTSNKHIINTMCRAGRTAGKSDVAQGNFETKVPTKNYQCKQDDTFQVEKQYDALKPQKSMAKGVFWKEYQRKP